MSGTRNIFFSPVPTHVMIAETCIPSMSPIHLSRPRRWTTLGTSTTVLFTGSTYTLTYITNKWINKTDSLANLYSNSPPRSSWRPRPKTRSRGSSANTFCEPESAKRENYCYFFFKKMLCVKLSQYLVRGENSAHDVPDAPQHRVLRVDHVGGRLKHGLSRHLFHKK